MMISLLLILLVLNFNSIFAFQVRGLNILRVTDSSTVDLENLIKSKDDKTMLVVGTYAADFNNIEYAQRLKYYIPQLKEKGVRNFIMIMNAQPSAVKAFANILNLQSEIELYSDSTGSVGKALKVCRGYSPDDKDTNPYVKLFVMLFGLGAWATLPSVIGGYIGNPFTKQPWIEAAMAENQIAGLWPNNVLELEVNPNNKMDYKVIKNKFAELKYVGTWGRRPLELATLRLQNMLGISLNNWNVLKPNDNELKEGILTQLGACYVLDSKDLSVKYEWKDEGICHVANFEDILKVI